MKRLKGFLKGLIFVEIGVCIGRIIQKCLDYQAHPKAYMVYSAPWYTEIYIILICTLVGLAVTGVFYGIVSHKIKKRELNDGRKKNGFTE